MEDEALIIQIAQVLDMNFETIPFALAEAEDLRTTDELTRILESHLGGELEPNVIRKALQSCDIRSRLIGEKFYWILRKKA